MIYRLLEVSEWAALKPEFDKRNMPLPDPKWAMIFGALNDDQTELQGFWVCQLQLHVEPLVIYNPHVLGGLVNLLESELKKRFGSCDAYAFVDGHSEEIARALGAEWIPLNIYKKVIH